MEIDPGKAVF